MAKSYLDKDGLLYFLQKIRPDSTPLMDGTASTGSAKRFALQDHVHPTDTSRAPLASPALTGTPTAPTAATGTSTTQIATTEFVANTVGAMTSGVSDVRVNNTSVVTGGIANINLTSDDIQYADENNTTVTDKLDNLEDMASSAATTAFTVVAVSGQSSVYADSKADTLNLAAGSNVTLTTDATTDTVTIAATDTTYSAATTSASGLMSATDKELVNTFNGYGVIVRNSDSITVDFDRTNDSSASYSLLRYSARGAANGVAPLNASSKIDATYLPSYVDDVIEAYPRSGATALSSSWLSTTSGGSALTPETGKIYVLMADSGDYAANTQFRWGGTAYVKLSDGGVSAITNAEIDTIVAS